MRLVLMARFGMDLPTDIIEEQISTAIDLVVMSRRMPDGSRVISSMSTVGRGETSGISLTECVSFEPSLGRWHLESEPAFVIEGVASGAIPETEVNEWRLHTR